MSNEQKPDAPDVIEDGRPSKPPESSARPSMMKLVFMNAQNNPDAPPTSEDGRPLSEEEKAVFAARQSVRNLKPWAASEN